MKITVLLIVVACLQVKANVFAQKITFSAKNVPLSVVFKALKKQSGYTFFYESKLLQHTNPVDINVKEAPLDEVLAQVLKGQSLTYGFAGKIIVIKRKSDSATGQFGAFIPPIDIKGRVLDNKGQPLPGASIKVKGTNLTTITDDNGAFSIKNVPDEGILVISYVGFAPKEISVKADLSGITLSENQALLSDVVIVGYGTQKRTNLTGSQADISSKDIENLPITNLTNALVGRLPGLVATNPSGAPGTGSNIQIRGNSTLNDNSTLIVVDGIVRADGFANINPDDVANITILKDAASTAVYGARAANGVILVTTKRGTTGKPTISYSGMYGVQNPINYPKLMDAFEYASLRNQALLNQGFSQSNPTQALLFFTQDQLNKFQQGIGTEDWYEASFKKNSPQTQHSVSVSGGNEAVRYFTSLGFLSQNGMYENINVKRYNFRSNLDAKINKNLNLTFNIEGRQEDNKAPGLGVYDTFYNVIRQRPTQIAYYPNGLPANTSGEHPVEAIRNTGYRNMRTKTIVGTVTLEQKLPFITEGLSIKALAGVFSTDSIGKNFLTPYKMYDVDAAGNVTNVKVVGGRSQLTQRQAEVNDYTLNLSLNYNRTFGKHEVSGLLLGESFQSTGNFFQASRNEFFSDLKQEFFASGSTNQDIRGTSLVFDTRQSLVGRFNYAFDRKYLLEFSFRADGSFRFPPGDQWGFFPAVSAGWRISEEKFFKNARGLSFVNNLKLRASKGLVGNDRVGAFEFQESYVINSASGPSFNNSSASLINYGVFPNESFTWETQNSNNIGLDADLFNSKLNFTFDYFFRTTKDILRAKDRSTPATFGRTLPVENYAEMKSHGFEASINHSNRVGNVSYRVGVNGSYATNEVTVIDDPANALDYQKQLGRVYGYVYGYEALGLFQSDAEAAAHFGGKEFGQNAKAGDIKYADINGDGQITAADQKVLSTNNYTPRVIYGLTGSVSYKGFDFNFLIQGAAKRNIMLANTARVLFQNGGSSNSFQYLTDSWTPTNTTAAYPLAWIDSRSINDRPSSLWLKDAGYARLKSADLGYTFGGEKIKSLGIQRLKVYVSGTNLLTLTKFKQFDPEGQSANVSVPTSATQSLSQLQNNQQQSGAYYPQQRVVSVGVNLVL